MKNAASFALAFGLAVVVVSTGCKKDEAPDIDLGDVSVAPYTVHVLQEGTFGPNTTTKYAIQTSGGPGKADTVVCWFGAETNPAHVDGSYDANDGDWDCLVPTPATVLPTDKLWFTITVGGKGANGSVTPKP